MYNLRSRLQRVNYRTLHGLPDSDMSAHKHTEHSEISKVSSIKTKVKRVGKGNLGRTAQARACHGYKQERE